jgi:3-methyl-2-oxobutanoate hydroxymethyltransferase
MHETERTHTTRTKLTPPAVRAAKGRRKLAMVTAYDYLAAQISEAAELDILLVGDSLGMVVLGYESTVPVTLDEMIHHGKAVVRGAPRTHIVVDLPFGSYQVSDEQAVESAVRVQKETECDAVKLEGGTTMATRIAAITRAGIPAMAHLGLTPQTAGALGGFKAQGRDRDTARALLADADAVAAAGAYGVVLEAIPRQLAALITARVPIPTIGIGAGPDCDGQVLVNADLLGLFTSFTPKFVKRYANLDAQYRAALADYAAEVRAGDFPAAEHTFTMQADVLQDIIATEKPSS